MPQDQNITIGNINSIAEAVASLEDTDFIYVLANKEGANTFCKIQKGLLLAGLSGVTPSSGGMSAEVYQAIQDNVETLRSKINGLIGDLAALAFSGNKTDVIANEFTWPENESGGGTPALTPKITAPSSTQDIGTIPVNGSSVSKSITVKGQNLNQSLTVAVSGTGFSVSPTTLTAAAVNNGTSVTVTYNGTSTSDVTGSLTISSSEVSKSVSIVSRKAAAGTFTVSFVSPDNSLVCTPTSGWSVVSGDGWQGTLSLSTGTTNKQIPQSISDIVIGGTHADVNYDSNSGWLSISTITSDITISAVAESVAVEGYSVTNRLLNMTSNGAASTDGTTDYTATIAPNSGAVSNNDLKVLIGETNVTSGCTFSNGSLTIPSSLITGDIVIEATAHTGIVKAKASDAATISINNQQYTLQGTGEWEEISTSITTISTMSVSSSDRTLFTEFDFGGAVATGFFSAMYGFVGMQNVTAISGLVIKASTGSGNNSMASAFQTCRSLASIDTYGWELGEVTSFAACFNDCRALVSLYAVGWVSDKCTDIRSMFYNCLGLTEVIGLNTWDVSNVTNMTQTFAASGQSSAPSLNYLDIRGWETTSALTSMANFIQYSSITTLIIGNLVTSGLTSVLLALQTRQDLTLVCTANTPPALNETNNLILNSNNKLKKIRVNSNAALAAYRADSNWNQFAGTWEVSQ